MCLLARIRGFFARHYPLVKMALVVILLAIQALTAECLFYQPLKVKLNSRFNDDGEPLFLTPFIESGKIEEAKKLARVSLPGFPDLECYAGFITVDKTYNSNLFVWYFPAEIKDIMATIVWLQGGPGSTSIFGLFDENGPIFVKDGKFQRRSEFEYWSEYHNVIYIDNPVGAGFSFTDSRNGYSQNQTHIADQLYKALTQFYKLFPELLKINLVISGESYGGKHAVSLAYTIHKNNPSARARGNPVLPLKGVTIGNGWCDPINQLDYADFLYQTGLLHVVERDEAKKIAESTRQLIKKESWTEAYNSWKQLMRYILNKMLAVSIYNFGNLVATFPDKEVPCTYCDLLTTAQVRKAIHVGNLTFDDMNMEVNTVLAGDFMKSIAPLISEVLENYPVWFYNGQLDIIVAYPLTTNSLRQLKWSGSESYLNSTRGALRLSYKSSRHHVGFGTYAGNLMDTLIRVAGHMAPADQPLWTWALLDYWMTYYNIRRTTDTYNNLLPRIQFTKQDE